MDAVFDFKQERGLKGFVLIALGVIVTMLAAITLSGEDASADAGYATAQTSQVSTTQNVGAAGLMLFPSSNLKGALK